MYNVSGINAIPFRGCGETAGSVSYLSNSFSSNRLAEDSSNTDTVKFRSKPAETAGSVANRIGENPQGDTVEISSKAETAGSVAYRLNDEPEKGTVNFRGNDEDYNKQKSIPWGGIILGTLLTGVLAIGALGYAHKANVLEKLNDGFIKNTLTKCDPAMKKCHEWCAKTKNFGISNWEKIKNFFSSKK